MDDNAARLLHAEKMEQIEARIEEKRLLKIREARHKELAEASASSTIPLTATISSVPVLTKPKFVSKKMREKLKQQEEDEKGKAKKPANRPQPPPNRPSNNNGTNNNNNNNNNNNSLKYKKLHLNHHNRNKIKMFRMI